MKKSLMLTLGTAVLMLAFSAVPHPAWTQEKEHTEDGTSAEKHESGAMSANAACGDPVTLSEAAEKKLGGSLYTGPLPEPVMKMAGMKTKQGVMQSKDVSAEAKPIADMAGAHNVHKGPRGGEFIMVPDNLRHMEVVYTLECGFQLFMYNAFTQPINVTPFEAMILVLPEGGDKFFEIMRFLVPSKDGTVLQTPLKHSHDDPSNPKGLFEVELYIKFPEDFHAHKFDLIVGTEAG